MDELDPKGWQPVNKQYNINLYVENNLQDNNTDNLTEQCKGHIISNEHFELNGREQLKYDYISEHCGGEGAIFNNYGMCDVVNYDYANVYNHNNMNIGNCNQLLDQTNTKIVDNWSAGRMLAEVFDIDGIQTHLLWYGMSDDHTNISEYNLIEFKTITLTFFNMSKLYYDQWVQIVYVQDTEMEVNGYYELVRVTNGSRCSLFRCDHLPEGYLQVIGSVSCKMVKLQCKDNQMYTNANIEAKLAYDNYCQDLKSWQQYECDYDSYMDQVMDKLIKCETELELDEDNNGSQDCRLHIKVNSPANQGNNIESSDMNISKPSLSKLKPDRSKIKDFNYSDKTMGYLAQANTDFVFIGPDKCPIQLDSVDTLLKTASIIRDTGQPNYKVARIPIESGLNVAAWEKYLENYSDKRIIQYIKFGFPLSLIDPHELNNTKVTNHFSACQYPQQVQEYIDKEIKLGALLGPVDSIIDSHFHCSPLLTRPKDADKRRVILNLSHPYGNSVNSHVDANQFDGSPFILKFPTVDDIAEDIIKCTEDTLLFKVDVARAFRNLRVDPVDSLKFGIAWRGAFYVDIGIAFGWTHGSASFQLLSDAVAYIMNKEGVTLRCYIDDYIAVVPKHKANHAFRRLCEVLNELGLPINRDKLTPPTKHLTCLGIDFDIENNIISISKDKLEAIYAECVEVSTKTSLLKRKYQSLLGKLLYIQKCVKPARVFINRLLANFRINSHLKTIPLSDDFHKDIQWFLTFLPGYNGISYIQKQKLDSGQSLYLDACLTGMGAVWRDRVYATPIHNCGGLDLKIIHLEMLNIVIALRTWGNRWCHSAVDIYCDNLGVVQVVETGKTRDQFLALCVRNIWLLTASLDIQLHIYHVPGVHNGIADALSRIYSDKPVNRNILQDLQDNYTWDIIPSQYFDLNLHL